MCVSIMPASPAPLTLSSTPQDSPVAAPAAWGSRASRRGSHLTPPHGLAKRASPPGPDHLPRRCVRRGRRPGSGLKQREHGTARGVTRAHGGTAGHGSESEAQALALNTDAVQGARTGRRGALWEDGT